MLILSRKKEEKVIIGDNIEITIIDIRESVVRIGFSAPPEVKIWRSEVLERIEKEHENNREGTPTKS